MDYQKARMKTMETGRLPTIHVSDLLSDCYRRYYYDSTTPREYQSMSADNVKSLVFGQILHSSIIIAPEMNEVLFAYDWKNDRVVSEEEISEIRKKGEFRSDIITGSADDIVEIEGEYIICDKKTTGSIGWFLSKKQANQKHKEQINMYRVLFNKCLQKDAKWGCNIYISNNINDPDRKSYETAVIPYKLSKVEEILPVMIERAKHIEDFMIKKNIPEPTYNWQCEKVCPWLSRCVSDA